MRNIQISKMFKLKPQEITIIIKKNKQMNKILNLLSHQITQVNL